MQDFNSDQLLVFAHRGEAQAFLGEKTTQKEFFFDGLFQHEKGALILICGEGLNNAREKTAAVLGAHPHLKEVINLGVAASLRGQYEKDTLHHIRTAYAEGEFKSFTSSDSSARIDVISSHTRVLSSEKRDQLDNFAPLAERELWAIAGVCALFNLPWRAIKLISDHPGEDLEICVQVKESAPLWSEKLLKAYLALDQQETPLENSSELNLGDAFHLTTTLTRQLLSYKERLGNDKFNECVRQIENLSFERPKERTLALMKELGRALNPFKAKFEDKLDSLCTPLNEAGIKVSFNYPLEHPHLSIKTDIQSEADLIRVGRALEAFSFDRFKSLIDEGNFDV